MIISTALKIVEPLNLILLFFWGEKGVSLLQTIVVCKFINKIVN